MKDTTTAVERLFTSKLMELAPDERLAMACRMFSTAKELVRVGISASEAMSAAEVRSAVFLRLYGQEFDQVKLTKILSQLEAT